MSMYVSNVQAIILEDRCLLKLKPNSDQTLNSAEYILCQIMYWQNKFNPITPFLNKLH